MRLRFTWRRKATLRQCTARKAGFRPAVEPLETRTTPSIFLTGNGTILQASGDNGGFVQDDTFELRVRPGTSVLQMRQFVNGQVVATFDAPASVTQFNVNGRNGTDTVVVKGLFAGDTLTATNPEVFQVGDNGSLAQILGNVVLTTASGGPSTAATVDDTLDTTIHDATLTRNSLSGLTTGGTLDFSGARLSSLTVNVCPDLNDITVLSTRGPTTLNGFVNAFVGAAEGNALSGDLTALNGPLTVNRTGQAQGLLVVADAASPVQNPIDILTAASFLRVGTQTFPGGVQQTVAATINYSGFFQPVFVTGGIGFSNSRVKGTAAGTATFLETRGAFPVVVGNDANLLDDIRGGLRVLAESGTGDTLPAGPLTLLDQGSTTAHSYDITRPAPSTAKVTRDDGVVIFGIDTAVVSLSAGTAADTFTVEDSSDPQARFVGVNGGGGLDRVIGRDVPTTFRITGANAGGVGSTIGFTAVENLRGGSADDTFVIGVDGQGVAGSLSGRIDGGGGVNTLDYRALATGVTVDLVIGTATRVNGLSNIQNVTGSQGDDLLRGNANANELRGVDGNDILIGLGGDDHLFAAGVDGVGTGTARRNILIGGTGTDVLEGSEGEDILLGGSFANNLDLNNAVLRAFEAAWRGTGDYASRTASLDHDGVVVNNVVFKLNGDNNRPDDGAADTVHGNGGLDWFWITDQDATDRGAGESRNDV
jgi:hypothetical protein